MRTKGPFATFSLQQRRATSEEMSGRGNQAKQRNHAGSVRSARETKQKQSNTHSSPQSCSNLGSSAADNLPSLLVSLAWKCFSCI
jgi:hypothetical protein